eukprot:3499541-Pyramimonas_sp.AAC.1
MLVASGHADTTYVDDLLRGFPLTETLRAGGLGVDVQGGVRSRGRPGLGGGALLSDLKQRCAEISARTFGRAQRRASSA